MHVVIKGADQLFALDRRLKAQGKVGKGLRKELLKGIRTAAKPALVATRAAVQAIPVTGAHGGGRAARERVHFDRSRSKTEEKRRAKARKNSGLRKTIAGAVKLKVKTNSKAVVRIYVDLERLPADQRTLPRHLDSKSGWRHPVFGDRHVWAHQQGRPWFAVTIRTYAPAVRREILRSMDRVAKKVEKAAKSADTEGG